MKRLCVFLAIAGCFVFCAACSDVPQSGAVIMGDLSGFAPDDSITVYLFHYDGPAGMSILTDTLRDGHFYFRLDSLHTICLVMALTFIWSPAHLSV